MSIQTDVIVVGAGLSGLSAAKLLHEKSMNVIVLEARDRVGGRTFTEHNSHVNYVDLGAAYVGPTQNRILRLVDEFGIKTYPTDEVEDVVFYTKGQARRFTGTHPPTGSALAYMDMNNIFRLIDKMGEEIPPEAPWNAQKAKEWDSVTVKEFFDKHIWTRIVRRYVRGFIRVNLTTEPEECSLLWFLWYIRQCGGTDRIHSTDNGGQERKLVGGTQQISERIVDIIGKEKVHLGCPVNHIKQDEAYYTVTDMNGNTYVSRYVIMAVPLPLQNRIVYEPPLPSIRNQLIQRTSMGSVIKTFMYYDSPFWKDNGFCGTAFIDEEDAIVEWTMDNVFPDGSKPSLMGFILADKARELSGLTIDERRDRIGELYAKVFKSKKAKNPIHYEELNWPAEQWSGGCYSTVLPPGFLTKFGSNIRRNIGKMFFAGTETATEWSGYMEGAVQAGERSAREVLADMGKVSTTDIWQNEPENKKCKQRPFPSTLMKRYLPSVPGFLTMLGAIVLVSTGCAVFTLNKRHRLLLNYIFHLKYMTADY